MLQLFLFITRKKGTTSDEFKRYYEQQHVPLVYSVLGSYARVPITYERNYVDADKDLYKNKTKVDFDVVTTMTFDDAQHFKDWSAAMFKANNKQTIKEDENKFMERDLLRGFVVEKQSGLTRPLKSVL